jgi:imidazole glycerol-phosphate synthase subunit HisF
MTVGSTNARRVRVIPTLLIDGRGRLVKTVKFGKRTYIGDPINAVKIFNAKEVDELVLLDIDATRDGRSPNYGLIEDIVSEAFMPVGYGGGIRTMEQVQQLYKCGIEKVVVSSCLVDTAGVAGGTLIQQASARFGAQAVVACLPVKKALFGGYSVRVASASKALPGAPEDVARRVVADGAGELIIYAIDRDGTFAGYDIELLRRVSAAVTVPVVACGGAGQIDDFRAAIVEGACSAAAAGSVFVYQSKGRGVLISYPSPADLATKVFERLN